MPTVPTYFGYNPPFFGGHQNVLSRQSGDRIIKNDLRQLLLTSINERVMRPTWGTILHRAIFEPIDSQLLEDVRDNLNNVIAEWEPRVRASVEITTDPDEHVLTVIVTGVYTDQPRKRFDFELTITPGDLASGRA